MRVKVITPKIQQFGAARFYKAGRYFRRVIDRRKSLLLHRVVWEHYHGPIPEGHHVHHKDGDRSNNQIENLELMKAGEHLRQHMTPKRRAQQREHMIKNVHPFAAKWHGSAAGRAWHSKIARSRPAPSLVTRQKMSESQQRIGQDPKVIKRRQQSARRRSRTEDGRFLPLT